jgi:hypothetical protein
MSNYIINVLVEKGLCTDRDFISNNLINFYKMETTEEVRFCKIILILLFSFMGNHQSVRGSNIQVICKLPMHVHVCKWRKIT